MIIRIFLVLSIAMSMNMDGRSQIITGRPLSLQECVQAAWENNPDVKQSDFSMERAAVTWRQSKANLLPNISGEIDHTLSLLIDPIQKMITIEELIEKYNYPDIDLSKVDFDYNINNF